MTKKMEEKKGNLEAQRKQASIQLQELEVGVKQVDRLIAKIDGALEFINSLEEEEKPKDKKEK
jgi:uncharacterized protein YjcR